MFKPSLEALEDRTMPSICFGVLPPEINSARMYVGAGSGPMLVAAAAWDGLAGDLGSAAASFAALSGGAAATVHPEVVAANRSQLVSLIATNFFGQNTPAIAATEAQYMEMWAQDAASLAG